MKRTKLMAYALLMMTCIAVNAAYSLARVQDPETVLCAAPAMPTEGAASIPSAEDAAPIASAAGVTPAAPAENEAPAASAEAFAAGNTAVLPTVSGGDESFYSPEEGGKDSAAAPTLTKALQASTANRLWDAVAPESIQTLGELLTDKTDAAGLFAAAAAYNRETAAQRQRAPEALNTAGENAVPAGPALVSLGTFKMTAYCPCPKCCGRWSRTTSSGRTAVSNHTIAVDPRVIPIGSRIVINGTEYVAEDTGGAIKGKRIDIFFDTHSEAKQYGVQSAEVFLVQ